MLSLLLNFLVIVAILLLLTSSSNTNNEHFDNLEPVCKIGCTVCNCYDPITKTCLDEARQAAECNKERSWQQYCASKCEDKSNIKILSCMGQKSLDVCKK
jgi:hypothetical protein